MFETFKAPPTDKCTLGQNMDDPGFALSVWPALLDLAKGEGVSSHNHPLWSLYAPVAEGRGRPVFVLGQLGQSLDGRVATPTGKSRTISGPEAIRHLHRLRALVDAVVVGIGTVIKDDPLLSVRDVEGRSPARVIIDPNFRLPPSARLLGDGGAPVIAIQAEPGTRPAGVDSIVIPAIAGKLSPDTILAALAERGLRRLLIEGGPSTLSAFIAAGLLHRLHVTVSPIILGSGPTGLNMPPIDELREAIRPKAQVYRLGADILFDCQF